MLGICGDHICMYMWSPSFTSSSFIPKPILLWQIPPRLTLHTWLPWLMATMTAALTTTSRLEERWWINVGLGDDMNPNGSQLVILSTQSSQPNNQGTKLNRNQSQYEDSTLHLWSYIWAICRYSLILRNKGKLKSDLEIQPIKEPT